MDTLRITSPRQLPYTLLAVGVTLAVLGALTDPGGRLIALPGAAVALVAAAFELRAGPVLVADAASLTVRQGWRRVQVSWPQVERMRVVKDRRAQLLEIDVGATVLLVSRTRLGRYPDEVLAELEALRAAARSAEGDGPGDDGQ